jgi:CBS domain-containing protein
MNSLRVRDIMTNLVVTLRPEDSIPQAARQLLSNRISGCPVVEGGKLVGVVTEADLVAAWSQPARLGPGLGAAHPLSILLRGGPPADVHGKTIADVMTTTVLTISPGSSVWEAARVIDRYGIRRLPVVDTEGFVVGIVARADLIRAMARSDEDIERSLRETILALGEENFENLAVEVLGGVATIRGFADRRSTHTLAIKLAREVAGVLEVNDELGWRWDDTHLHPAGAPQGLGRDPKAVGPLVG